MIVPGGGIFARQHALGVLSIGFLLPVRVLSRLFRRLFLTGLADAHGATRLVFFGDLRWPARPDSLYRPSRAAAEEELVVYAKPPFAGPRRCSP